MEITKFKALHTLMLTSILAYANNAYASDNQYIQLQNEITILSNQVSALQPHAGNDEPVTTGEVGGGFVANASDQNRSLSILQLLQNSNDIPTLNIEVDTQVNAMKGFRTSSDSIAPNDNYIANTSTSKIFLNDAKIVILANANDYIHFQGRFGQINPLVDNDASQLTLEDATIFFGDLNKTPFYAEAGQEYVNFGVYNEAWFPTDSLSKQLFFTGSLPEVLAGYYINGINLTVSAYQRDNPETAANTPNNPAFAAQAQYEYDFGDNNVTFGTGILTDERSTGSGIAQLINDTNKKGVSNTSALPALDINASLTYGSFDINVEYNKLLKTVYLGQNKKASNISAVSTQLDYVINTAEAITLSAGYSHSFGLSYVNNAGWNNPVTNMAQGGFDVQATENVDIGIENTYAREYTSENKLNSVDTITLLVHAVF